MKFGLRSCALAFAVLTSMIANRGVAAGQPAIDPGFIVFGYLQSESIIPHIRWNALTHVGGVFTGFNSLGNLTSNISTRDADLKAGGAAQAAGVKFIMVVASFDDSSGGVIQDVMTDYTVGGPKEDLIANIIAQMNADAYCGGVSFDIEFSWGISVRDGIADFLTKMRTAINAQAGKNYQMSIYVHPSHDPDQWNAPNLALNCDYILQSGYDYGSGRTAHAITDQNGNMTALNGWFAAGIPPEKMIYTISAYGRRWWNATKYNQTQPDNPKNIVSLGFTDGKYDTTLRQTNGGPFVNNYVTGDEGAWYTYDNGTSDSVTTWDNEDSMEYKMRTALAFAGSGSFQGRRMKGVGFWSLMWMAEQTSRDPIQALNGSYTRTYPHIYQLTEEILSPPGTTRYVFNKFEGLDPRWDGFTGLSNSPSPDNVNFNTGSTRAIIASPAGAGAPPNSTNAMRLNFTWTTPANAGKCFFRHEMLNSNTETSIRDTNATNAHFDANSKINAYINTTAAYSGTTVRLVVIDKNRQLEASPATSLNVAGWQLVTWDLLNTAATGLTTVEPGFVTGNGTIDTAGFGADDISFVGFLVEHTAGGAGTGSIFFDELSYEASTPSSRQFVINEFHSINPAREFVEIKGPPSTSFPANMGLVFYDGASSVTVTTVTLGGQSIPGSGYFVVGDPGTANVNLTPGGWTAVANNIYNTEPLGIQLIDTVSGCVYDSVVVGAMGGLGELVRRQTQGVTNEGNGWIGEGAAGTNGSSINYTYGRYPDGVDTQVNQDDFTYLGPTPGATNGGSSVLGQTYDFTTLPANLYQTYEITRSVSPASNGLPALNGNALRMIDTSGGGAQAFMHDPSLGTNPYTVTGNIYIPGTGAAAQAVAVGLAGRQGSTFFSASPAGSGYEDGYWLIYEQGAIDINDSQAGHNGSFQFLWATNDNADANRSTALGTNKTRANVGVTAGQWTTFRLTMDPTNPTLTNRLIAQINNVDVYRGDIPAGGPTTGSFQVGFRQTGAVTNDQGTWIDNLAFSSLSDVQEWSLY